MLLGRAVERAEKCAALHPGALSNRIDPDRTHGGEIDHQAIIRNSQADHAVSPATHADLEIEIACRPNRCLHIRHIAAANDETGPPIDHRIPNGARRVVAGISRLEHVAGEGLRKAFSDHVTMTALGGKTHRTVEPASSRDIFHITTDADWARAQAEGAYSASTRGRTLAQVGFVHCAFEEQVAAVANSFFRGVAKLVVLRIAIDKLDAEVRYEDLEGGNVLFPHVYGPLNLDAVVAIMPLARGRDGTFTFTVAATS
jgi:glutathione S-transferase